MPESRCKGKCKIRGIKPGDIAVVKKTFNYSNVFFHNHLYRPAAFRNVLLKSGIKIEGQ